MSNTWSIITMATFSSDLFEGCRFMWYRDFEEIRTQIMWTSFPLKITSKRSCRNFLHWKRSFCWMKLNLIGLVRTPSQCSFQCISLFQYATGRFYFYPISGGNNVQCPRHSLFEKKKPLIGTNIRSSYHE